MKPFIERLQKEQAQLNRRLRKLSSFIGTDKFNALHEVQQQLLSQQLVAMESYNSILVDRLSSLHAHVDNSSYISFGEALEALKEGKIVARELWMSYGWFIVKQIDSIISADVVPKMQSLPDSAKSKIKSTSEGIIRYQNQCLIVKDDFLRHGKNAKNYVPDWEDIFAEDWVILS